jgi:hypothetical protein
VLLPWDRQGKARSGLRRRCAAVATWQAEIAVGDVQEVAGILPPTVIGELLGKVSAAVLALPERPAARPSGPATGPAGDPPATGSPAVDDGH